MAAGDAATVARRRLAVTRGWVEALRSRDQLGDSSLARLSLTQAEVNPADSPDMGRTRLRAAAVYSILVWQARPAVSADVTYGVGQEFDADSVSRISSAEIGTDKFVVCYADDQTAQCRAATVSGTVASFGSEIEVDPDIVGGTDVEYNLAVCRLADDKFGVVYASDSVYDGYVRIGSVSGTTITLGSALQFETGDAEWIGCENIGADKFVVAYDDETDSDSGKAVVCVAAGIVASCGAPTRYHGSTDYYAKYNSPARLATDKFMTAFESEDDDDGYMIAATVSGTTPSFGAAVKFSADNPNELAACSPPSDDDRFVVVYRNVASAAGQAIAGTTSGTTITLGAVTDFNPTSGDVHWPACSFTDRTHFVVAYEDVASGQHGKSALCEVDWSTRLISCHSDETFAALNVGSQTQGADTEQRVIETISGYGTRAKVVVGYVEDADGDDGMVTLGLLPRRRRVWLVR